MKTFIEFDDENFDGQYCHAAHVRVIDNCGVIQEKYVDIKELLQALSDSTVSENEMHRIGKLPQHYYDGVISREGGILNGKIVMIVPKGKRHTVYENTKYHIPFPTMLFYFEIVDERIDKTKVYALKGKRYRENSVLYNYPFGNVSLYAHTVCWGSNILPKINDLQTLDVICSLFYDSPSNNDYYTPKRSSSLDYSNLRGIYERLKDFEEFPEEILVPSGSGSLGQLLQNLE